MKYGSMEDWKYGSDYDKIFTLLFEFNLKRALRFKRYALSLQDGHCPKT